MSHITQLKHLQNWFEEKTTCGMFFDYATDGTEIKVSIRITEGWSFLEDHEKNFNACDWETNSNAVYDLINSIDKVKYAKEHGLKKS